MTKSLDPNAIPPVEITSETLEEYLAAYRSGSPVVVPRHLANQLARQLLETCESHEQNRQQKFVLIQKDLRPMLECSPVTFAVRLRDGSAGSMWKVVARGRGDVYIVPRDIMEGAKISLHASGQQHLRVIRPLFPRVEKKWKEPPRESPLPASVKLIFTVWSAGMGPTRDHDATQIQRQWGQNQVLIEGENSEDSVITVCFFLTPSDVDVELPPWPPMARFAALHVGAGKDLHIIARRERRRNLRVEIEKRLAETFASGTVSAPIGQKSLLLLCGDDVDGCTYVSPVSVKMIEQGRKLCRRRRTLVALPNIVSH